MPTTKRDFAFETLDYMNFERFKAVAAIPEDAEVVYNRVVSCRDRPFVGLLVRRPNGAYLIADEYGAVKVNRNKAANFLASLKEAS